VHRAFGYEEIYTTHRAWRHRLFFPPAGSGVSVAGGWNSEGSGAGRTPRTMTEPSGSFSRRTSVL